MPVKYGARRRSHGLKTKTLRRMLKKKGMKTTGKKATLMKRLHMRGGVGSAAADGADDVKIAPAEGEGAANAVGALDAEPEFADSAQGSSDAAASGSSGAAAAGRRRRRSRRREEGGRRRSKRREVLGY
jgi:hypothetical protein